MGIFDEYYIKKYKKVLNKIEYLNKKNTKGYKTFSEYVIDDKQMRKYFNELKLLEKKCLKIHVESYEQFENDIHTQLKKIYTNMIRRYT